ncbi:MaoC family dehydratase [Alkaliphilus crotonatoxidans]
MIGKRISELRIGEIAAFEKTISESDVYLYAGITGDMNPAHINERAASETAFNGRIVHGMLTAGLISAVLGMQLPGPGSIYLGQELKFLAPVRIGDTIKAKVEITEIFPEKNRVTLRTTCENQEGKLVMDGFAKIMPPK